MELRQLRYITEVAASGSISRAAERLCISPSAVSRQIADLESELGVVLLQRQRAGGMLTDAGLRFVEGATDILAAVHTLRTRVSAQHGEPQKLRIGLPPTVSPILLPLMTTELPDSALPLRPSVVEDSSHWLEQRLAHADVDCAVLTNPSASRSTHVTPLWREQLFLVGRADAPWAGQPSLDIQALANLPLTLTPPGDPSREAIEAAFRTQGVPLQVQHEHEAVNLLRELIVQGLSCSILSQTVVHSMTPTAPLAAVPVRGLVIGRGLAVRRGALPRQMIEQLAERLRHAAQQHFASGAWIFA